MIFYTGSLWAREWVRTLKTIQVEREKETVDSVMSFESCRRQQEEIGIETQEFDPGSGRTLAACLTHASRAGIVEQQCDTILAADG